MHYFKNISTKNPNRRSRNVDNDHLACTEYNVDAITDGVGSNATTTDNFSNAVTKGPKSHSATSGKHSDAETRDVHSNAATNGDYSVSQTQRDSCHASSNGIEGVAITHGNSAHASAIGYKGIAIANGRNCISFAGICGLASAGEGGTIIIMYQEPMTELIGVRTGKIGEYGLCPNVLYKLNDDLEFEEAQIPTSLFDAIPKSLATDIMRQIESN